MNEFLLALLVLVVGIVASTVNTVVGGGSYLTLPLLVFLGLGPHAANATNRLAVCCQTLAATRTLRSGGIRLFRVAIPASCAALLGGIPGAYLATILDADAYRQAMGWLLLAGVASLFFRRKPAKIISGPSRLGSMSATVTWLVIATMLSP